MIHLMLQQQGEQINSWIRFQALDLDSRIDGEAVCMLLTQPVQILCFAS
nr:hypothetical protein SYMBAF_250002 [Serratia symbiotica]CDS59072.1 hypothetical protein SYMBAF_90319 [Serratia symbiotica]